MKNFNEKIATLLNCSSTEIPPVYKDKAVSLSTKFINQYNLTGLYNLQFEIVYNHVCFLIMKQLEQNPNFSLSTFSDYINEKKMFYGYEMIQLLIQLYRENPNESFCYLLCFFAKKYKSVREKMLYCTKHLDREEIDEAIVVATFEILNGYDPKDAFSFEFMEIALKAAIAELAGDLFPVRLPRNDLTSFFAFSYYIEKYALTPCNIESFLYELSLTIDESEHRSDLLFKIDRLDRIKHRHIPLSKALIYYQDYLILHDCVSEMEVYDKEHDCFYDITNGVPDDGFTEAELRLLGSQICSNDSERLIFNRWLDTGSSSFTNRELTEKYHSTRYALQLQKKHTLNCLIDNPVQKRNQKRDKFTPIE